jgi:transposase
LARRTFDVIDVIEILTHWYAGRSQNELATSLGVDRKTLRKYTAPAVAAGMAPGGSPMDEADWRRLATEWFPQLTDHRLRQVSWPSIEPHRDYIAAQLKAGVTVATIHQRLRDEHGLTASVASVRRWVRATLPEQARRAQVTVLGDAPPPGEQAQIDYGRLGMWLDPATGRRRAVWAFVMVLACSRHLFVRPTLVMDQAEWTAAHVEAFAFFGGVPARLVPDNLKTGVDKPDLYDPKINRSYAELAAHYDTLVDPARAAKPKDKPQVERPMPYVRDSFWRGREFGSLAGMRADALRWSREVAGTRACRPLDGAAPAAVFAAGRGIGVAAVAGRAVRARDLVGGPGRARHPRAYRRHALLAALAVPGRPRRCPLDTVDGAVLPPRPADQDPSAQGPGQADRPGRLPTGEVG